MERIALFKIIELFGGQLRNQVDFDSLSAELPAELLASLIRPWSPTWSRCRSDLPHATSGAPVASTTDYLGVLSTNTNRYLRSLVD